MPKYDLIQAATQYASSMDVGAWGTTLPAAGLLDTRALCECRRSECGQHAREDHREQTDHQQPRAPVRVGGRASTIGHPSSPSPMYPPGSQPGGTVSYT